MGITKSEANHLKNLCKEVADRLLVELNSVKCYENTITLLNTNSSYKTINGSEIEFKSLKENLQRICQLYSFSAYIGEEIKRLSKEAEKISSIKLDEYLNIIGKERPVSPQISSYTEEDAISEMSEEEKAEFYGLEARTAHLGKALHSGFINGLKEQISSVKQNPCNIEGTGRDVIVNKRSLVIKETDFNAFFFEINEEYRESQKKLNYLKSKINDKVTVETVKRLEAYNKAYDEYSVIRENLHTACEEYKVKKLNALSREKITIPENLKLIYQFLITLA
jgi:hypothetical protein